MPTRRPISRCAAVKGYFQHAVVVVAVVILVIIVILVTFVVVVTDVIVVVAVVRFWFVVCVNALLAGLFVPRVCVMLC